MLDLQAYLDRIGYPGAPRPDLETLVELHRRHLLAIPYENLDVQLERPVGLEPGPIYEKLVRDRRGGWCYEMNGLFGWALEEIGFSITRLGAGVGRAQVGDAALGNHLALRVELDRPYLADVGFGDGIFEPVPIRSGAIRQRGFRFRMERLAGGWWRMHNHPRGAAPSFDFDEAPGDPVVMQRKCAYLQTAPDSTFRRVAVVQRHVPQGLVILRGRVLTRISPSETDRRLVGDQAEYERVLREELGLDGAAGLRAQDLDALWEKAQEQHWTFLREQAAVADRRGAAEAPAETSRHGASPHGA
jgi:N-hydroxyarylamine O-acetyltransferase